MSVQGLYVPVLSAQLFTGERGMTTRERLERLYKKPVWTPEDEEKVEIWEAAEDRAQRATNRTNSFRKAARYAFKPNPSTLDREG